MRQKSATFSVTKNNFVEQNWATGPGMKIRDVILTKRRVQLAHDQKIQKVATKYNFSATSQRKHTTLSKRH